MADYRLSANVISRGKAQSAVACAAYRAGARLSDIRTGTVHDFTRKGGVEDNAVLAPDDAPAWARDRQELWQRVEAVERRKDAQLAREVQLSLPHELTHEQRRELLHAFVREQFVSRGMVADVAIHAPGKEGDDRNHHAHVMLTMRELKGDGFGNKARDWNSPEALAAWREQWAHHQNRALERHGHDARVDHRSLADQGVDREPTQHMGPTATDMERNGQASRIGDENRDRDDRNTERAKDHATAVILDLAIERERRSMRERQGAERVALSADLERLGHEQKQTIIRELNATTARLEATGWRKMLRDLTGRSSGDRQHAVDLRHTLAEIQKREADRIYELDAKHQVEQRELVQKEHAAAADRERQRPLSPSERLREQFHGAKATTPTPPTLERTQGRPWGGDSPSNDAKPWARRAATRTRTPGEP